MVKINDENDDDDGDDDGSGNDGDQYYIPWLIQIHFLIINHMQCHVSHKKEQNVF